MKAQPFGQSDPTKEELYTWLNEQVAKISLADFLKVSNYLDRAEVWGLTESVLRLTRELCEEGYSLLESFDIACTYWDI
jgi:hypothetical protein